MKPETIAALKVKAWAESKMFPKEPPYSGAWNFGAEDMARAMLPEIERLERRIDGLTAAVTTQEAVDFHNAAFGTNQTGLMAVEEALEVFLWKRSHPAAEEQPNAIH